MGIIYGDFTSEIIYARKHRMSHFIVQTITPADVTVHLLTTSVKRAGLAFANAVRAAKLQRNYTVAMLRTNAEDGSVRNFGDVNCRVVLLEV